MVNQWDGYFKVNIGYPLSHDLDLGVFKDLGSKVHHQSLKVLIQPWQVHRVVGPLGARLRRTVQISVLEERQERLSCLGVKHFEDDFLEDVVGLISTILHLLLLLDVSDTEPGNKVDWGHHRANHFILELNLSGFIHLVKSLCLFAELLEVHQLERADEELSRLSHLIL